MNTTHIYLMLSLLLGKEPSPFVELTKPLMVLEPFQEDPGPFYRLGDPNPSLKRMKPFYKKYGDPEKNVNFYSVA